MLVTFRQIYPQIPTCRNLLTPEIPQMCEPILVTLLVPTEMQPHYSQSSRENATPSCGTSPLAYYKEVHPPGTQLTYGKKNVYKRRLVNYKQV